MKEEIIKGVLRKLHLFMDEAQINQTRTVLIEEMQDYEISPICEMHNEEKDQELISIFLSSKKIEGCSDKTISYYNSTIRHLLQAVPKAICMITTNDIRHYLSKRQEEKNLSKVTIDNIRRIFSSFFSWLEDEDYISKSPVRRIHKVRTDSLVKDTINDEDMETLRDSCSNMRDLAMIDLLASTGIRVGELVKINRSDIDFQERQCIVLGKGNKEREVYFNARTKIHLKSYLKHRTDNNPALFVSFNKPNTRLTIGGVEKRLSLLGRNANINKIHPHKFRRTLATKAIDKGMPIEQVQRLLGHVRIDTTLHYAMVNQTNVKMAHRKYIA